MITARAKEKRYRKGCAPQGVVSPDPNRTVYVRRNAKRKSVIRAPIYAYAFDTGIPIKLFPIAEIRGRTATIGSTKFKVIKRNGLFIIKGM